MHSVAHRTACVPAPGARHTCAHAPRVTQVWRAAIDAVKNNAEHFRAQPGWLAQLDKVSEGSMHTLGAYYRPWK